MFLDLYLAVWKLLRSRLSPIEQIGDANATDCFANTCLPRDHRRALRISTNALTRNRYSIITNGSTSRFLLSTSTGEIFLDRVSFTGGSARDNTREIIATRAREGIYHSWSAIFAILRMFNEPRVSSARKVQVSARSENDRVGFCETRRIAKGRTRIFRPFHNGNYEQVVSQAEL